MGTRYAVLEAAGEIVGMTRYCTTGDMAHNRIWPSIAAYEWLVEQAEAAGGWDPDHVAKCAGQPCESAPVTITVRNYPFTSWRTSYCPVCMHINGPQAEPEDDESSWEPITKWVNADGSISDLWEGGSDADIH